MERDELVRMVSLVLSAAHQRGDMPIITLCEELGKRLVTEGIEPQLAPSSEVRGCPQCEAYRDARRESQQRWRVKKREERAQQAEFKPRRRVRMKPVQMEG